MSRYEVEVMIKSATNIKNVNWRHGLTRPYVVIWVDPERKLSTKVDEGGDTSAHWDERIVVPFLPSASIKDTMLYIEVVHFAKPDENDVKALIGSAKLKLDEVTEEVGIGGSNSRTLKLKRPSGRPQGILEISLTIKENPYYTPQHPYGAPYGAPSSIPPFGYPYGAPPTVTPSSGYSYGAPSYVEPPSAFPYDAPPFAAPPSGGYPYAQSLPQGQSSHGHEAQVEKKKSKFGGIGTGLVVGALAGGLGALAMEKGVEAFEDHIADKATEKVKEDMAFRDEDDDAGW